MVTSHFPAGRLVLSLGTWTCQPVLRGRRATAPSTPWWLGGGFHPFYVGSLWDGQASCVNPWVWTHWVRIAVRSTVVHAKEAQVHFFGRLLTWEHHELVSLGLSGDHWGWNECVPSSRPFGVYGLRCTLLVEMNGFGSHITRWVDPLSLVWPGTRGVERVPAQGAPGACVGPCFCVDFAFLGWPCTGSDKVPSGTTTVEAAGLDPHRWGIILPNSSRVSLLTYKATVAVR